jgi:outer membrane lipoprotein-sorting protein
MKKLFIILSALTVCVAVQAQEAGDAGCGEMQKINQANHAYTSITASFKQTRHLSMVGENSISGGSFYYLKPDKLAMKYTQPAGDVLLINGNQFTLVAAGKEKKISSKNAKMEGMKTILSACLQGDIAQMGATKITCSENAGYYVIIADINEKLNKSAIRRVIASYEKTGGAIASIQTIEADGSYTLYELTDKKFNQPLEEEIFKN